MLTLQPFITIIQQDIDLHSSEKLNQYLSGIKINSAQARLDYQELTIQVFNEINDKQSAYLLILNSLNRVSMKTIIIEISSQIFLQQKQFGDPQQILKNWLNIPVELLPQFIEAYNLKLEQFQDVELKINSLFQNKKVTDAIKLIQLFHQYLDMKQYIHKFIQIERVQEFAKVFEQSPEIVPEFVAQLSLQANKASTKLAKELIIKYNLNKENYPKLISNMNKMAVENIYFPKTFEFQRVEERLSDYPFMLDYVVDKLIAHNMVDEAYSIVKRHNLDRNIIGNYIDNPLLSKDEFNLTEAVCLGKDVDEYIQFKHFGIQEQDIKWINNQDQLKECAQIILSQKIVGFDTEFQHYFNEFDCGGIALMQIATYQNIYLIDAIHFQEDPFFIQFLADFFTGDVQKVGHSVSNDLYEIGIKIKLPQNLQQNNMIDLSKLYNIVTQNGSQTSVSLANQANQLLKLKLSKAECFSNWTRRPLRKCQYYYAAMDAYICLVIYDKLIEIQENKDIKLELFQSKKQQIQQEKKEEIIPKDQHLRYHPKYEYLIQRKQMKFLIDEMLKRLSGFLRNLGIDAAQIEKNDHNGMEQLAIAEERIIITRDKKFFSRPLGAPCFLLSHDLNTEQQFEELHNHLNFTTSQDGLLTRCVKCNSVEIKVIDWNEAQKYLDFKNNDTTIQEFWQCANCKQVYWEGNQFKNSVERFSKVCQKNK